MTIVAMTGHRPEKIRSKEDTMRMMAEVFKDTLKPDKIIQGMASGVDLWSAQIAHFMKVPYIAAQPWHGHTCRKADVPDYEQALKNAEQVVVVSDFDFYPGAFVYQRRNEWMVDHADVVFGVWNGSRGGTYNCIEYAKKVKKPIYLLNPDTGLKGWYNETVPEQRISS